MDQQINQLEQQLREVALAQGFFETDFGKLWTQLVTAEVTKITREITSDKYLKDHTGYVNAVARLQAYQGILKSLQIAGSDVRKSKLEEKLDGLKS